MIRIIPSHFLKHVSWLIVLVTAFLLAGCQKEMYDYSRNDNQATSVFFNYFGKAPTVSGVINLLKLKNDSLDFVPRFVERYGMPVWDNSIYLEDSKYLLVPFRKPLEEEIEGVWLFGFLSNNKIHSFPVLKQKTDMNDRWVFDYFTCDVLKKRPKSGFLFDCPDTKGYRSITRCTYPVIIVGNVEVKQGPHCWNEWIYIDENRGSSSADIPYCDHLDFGDGGGGGGGSTPQPTETENAPKIIKDTTFVDTKADCIFEKMKMLSADFKSSIQKFDGDFPVAHLKFSLAELDSNKNAKTFAPYNYVIEIKINKLYLNNRPNLDIARTFAHEIIHAELYRKMLSLAQNGKLPGSNSSQEVQVKYIESMRDDFPGLYDYYQARNPDKTKDWEHNMMGEHYRDAIIDVLKKYDPNQTNEFYDALSWAGLKGTVSWNALKEDERSRLNNILSVFLKKGGEECK